MGSIEFQKMAGGVLFALILVVGSGLLSEAVIPEQEHAVEAAAPAAPGAAPAEQAAAAGGAPAPSFVQLLAAASPEEGKAAAKKCAACHTFEQGGPHRVGPNLFGIAGADIAAKEGFAYSPALQGLEGQWTPELLADFIRKPSEVAPGTKMTFAGVANQDEVADLVAFLHSISPDAPPLPAAQAAAPPPAPAAPADTTQAAPAAPAPAAPAAPAPAPAAPTAAPAPAGGSPALALLAQASPERGQAAIKKCVACHTFDQGGPHRVGPNLFGIVGADIAAKEGYKYSSALQGMEGVWTYEALDAFLAKPSAFAPGTKMTFAGVPKPEERADVIAYLRSISPNAPPLQQGAVEAPVRHVRLREAGAS